MKSSVCKAVSKILAIVAVGLALATPSSAQVEDWDFAARRLEGSWTTQVTQLNCATGAPLGPAFNGLLTFSRGGTLVESTASPSFFPAVRGPGHGIWSRANGHNAFNAVFVAHIILNGVLVKTQTVKLAIVRETTTTPLRLRPH